LSSCQVEGHYVDANVRSNVTLTVVKKLAILPYLSYIIPQQALALSVRHENRPYTALQLPSSQCVLLAH